MYVGVLKLEMHLPQATNLREKRKVVTRLQSHVRNHTKLTCAEVEHQDTYQLCSLAIVAAGSDPNVVDRVLENARKVIDEANLAMVLDEETDIIEV